MVLQMALFCSFFEWVDSTPLYICTISVDGHLACFHALAIVYLCFKHSGARIFLNYSFVQLYAQEWDCWIL